MVLYVLIDSNTLNKNSGFVHRYVIAQKKPHTIRTCFFRFVGVTGVVLLFDVVVVATGVVVVVAAEIDNDVVDVDSTRALSRYASVRGKNNKDFQFNGISKT